MAAGPAEAAGVAVGLVVGSADGSPLGTLEGASVCVGAVVARRVGAALLAGLHCAASSTWVCRSGSTSNADLRRTAKSISRSGRTDFFSSP